MTRDMGPRQWQQHCAPATGKAASGWQQAQRLPRPAGGGVCVVGGWGEALLVGSGGTGGQQQAYGTTQWQILRVHSAHALRMQKYAHSQVHLGSSAAQQHTHSGICTTHTCASASACSRSPATHACVARLRHMAPMRASLSQCTYSGTVHNESRGQGGGAGWS